MKFSVLREVIIYSAKPPTIFYPFPFVPLLIVSFAGGNFSGAIFVVVFTSLFYSALNLWNHVNDYKEDFKAGKNTPFILNTTRKMTIAYISLAYPLSGVIYLIFSHTIYGKLAFLSVLVLTFLYSDNTLTKLRLKKHYATELLTYFVCVPSFIIALYDLVKPVDLDGALLSLVLLPFVISTVFIKDLKDISEDREAGWKTLGVVFEAEVLVKLFFYLNIIFYAIFSLFLLKISKITFLFPLVFLTIPTYYTIKNFQCRWQININLVKNIQITIYTGFLFIIFNIVLFYLE